MKLPRIILNQTLNYTENGKPVYSLPKDFYSSDYFATSLVQQIRSGIVGTQRSKPFFAYLAFTAPHVPLQAPSETVAKYKGRYDGGYEVMRRQRLARQAQLGLMSGRTKPHDFDLAPAWSSLDNKEQALQSGRMEVYAAMIDRLDHNVGRLIQALRETDELDNTIILFMSDNGPEGTLLSSRGMAEALARNLSAGESRATTQPYGGIGAGFAEASSAPFWGVKGLQSEGGTRVPSFIWAPSITPGVGNVFTSVLDVTPTLLELAGIAAPERDLQSASCRLRGRSWVPWLTKRAVGVHSPSSPLAGELFGGRTVRRGDWKLLDRGDGKWRLFNLKRDPGETQDLSPAHAGRKAELVQYWHEYADEVVVVPPQPPLLRFDQSADGPAGVRAEPAPQNGDER